jgi:hypothetical protein
MTSSLDITEKSNPPEYPVIWILIGFQLYVSNVGQISPARFLVYRTLVHPGISWRCRVDGVDMYDRKWREQHLGGRLDEFGSPAIPACPIQIKTIDVNSFSRRLRNIVLVEACHVVM